jgi:hypothetical protein
MEEEYEIHVYGEKNHSAVRAVRNQIIAGLPKDVFILQEGAASPKNELDDSKASLQTDILFAYLFSRAPLPESEAQIVLKKKMNMVVGMLEEATDLPKSVDLLLGKIKSSWKDPNENKIKILSLISPLVKTFSFNYKEIWDHYFMENNSEWGAPYRKAMFTLLDLTIYDSFMVLTKGRLYEPFAVEFVLITQTAREDKMIQRIIERAKKGRVVVFTGFAHMQNLCDTLRKYFKVKCTVLERKEESNARTIKRQRLELLKRSADSLAVDVNKLKF